MIKLRVLDRLEVDTIKNVISDIRTFGKQKFHHFFSVLFAQALEIFHALHITAVTLNPILPTHQQVRTRSILHNHWLSPVL